MILSSTNMITRVDSYRLFKYSLGSQNYRLNIYIMFQGDKYQ